MDSSIARVIQITDTHICADPRSLLLGMPTRAALESVLGDIRDRYASFDQLLVTGDLSQDGSAESYRYLRDVLETVPAPVRCIPGNHDDRSAMFEILTDGMMHFEKPVVLNNWRIVFLDSSVAGAVHGVLSDFDLERLRIQLEASEGDYVMVAVHHPPVELGSRWMDEIRLQNGPRLLELVREFSCVKALLWGHAHQAYAGHDEHVRLFGTPSTCFQFAPGSVDFELDGTAPGYRVFDLGTDGTVASRVIRLTGFPYTPQSKGPGYN